MIGQILERADHRGVVPCLAAVRRTSVEKRLASRGIRQRDASDCAVESARFKSFWCSSMRKPGLNVRLVHPFAMHFQDPRRRKTAHQCRANLLRIHTGLGRQQQRLANRLDGGRDDHLVGELADLTRADVADERDILPIMSKSGFTRSKAACEPPTMIVSDAAFAPTSPPETGASR